MRLIDIIGIFVAIEFFYHTYKVMLDNFKNGYPLANKKNNIFELIRLIIYIFTFLNVSKIFQIIFFTTIIISKIALYIYVAVKTKTVHRDNPSLYEFYIAEIKKTILIDCVCVLLLCLIIYYNSLKFY